MIVFRASALAALLASTAALAQPAASSPAFGQPLACEQAPKSGTLLTPAGRGFAIESVDGTWVTDSMSRVGYPAALPSATDARDAALSAAGLLRRGHVVAAKMAHDEAAAKITAYAQSAFSKSFESLLTIVTQPVRHASYPTSVRAEGEKRADEHGSHTHGVDMEQSSASLTQIIGRAEVAKRAMGEHYRNPVIRSYLLAHGFRDDLALKASSALVCALKLGDDVKAKLDTSARFMAMPGAGEGNGGKQ